MTRTLALLLATTAATLTFGLPVLGAMQGADHPARAATTADFSAEAGLPDVWLVDGDDDEDDEDDDDEDEDDCDDEADDDEGDDDDADCPTTANPAPAGTTAPPDNGLFNNGTPPKVQVN